MTIRVTALFKRKTGTTHEEFVQYWTVNHAGMFTKTNAVKNNLVRYVQFRILQQPSQDLAGLGLGIAPYDGCGEFHVEKIEDLLAMFSDEEYIKTIGPDMENFLDSSETKLLIGEEVEMYSRK